MSEMSSFSLTLRGVGPVVFGAPVHIEKRPDEQHDQLEERIWKQKATLDHEGNLAIKAVAVHRALVAAAKWLNIKLDGNKKYTKRFEAGLIPKTGYFPLTHGGKLLTVNDCERFDLFCPARGQKGGTTRVWKTFPRLKSGWELVADFIVTDEALTSEIILKHAETAGLHNGLGSMRIGNGGPNGMFTAVISKFIPYEL